MERDTFSVFVEEKSERRGEHDEAVKCERVETILDAEGRFDIFRKEERITHPPLEYRKLRGVRELSKPRKLPGGVSDRCTGKHRADLNVISDGLSGQRAMNWGVAWVRMSMGRSAAPVNRKGTPC